MIKFKKIVIFFVIILLISILLNTFAFAKRMNYCLQIIDEIETNQIIDPSPMFNKQNLTKSQFLDFINIFEKHDYFIYYHYPNGGIHNDFSRCKYEIINRVNNNDDTILYSSYIDGFTLEDDLMVRSIYIYEINPNEAKENKKHYPEDFKKFLESKRKELYKEKNGGYKKFGKECIFRILIYSMLIISLYMLKNAKSKKNKFDFFDGMLYFIIFLFNAIYDFANTILSLF